MRKKFKFIFLAILIVALICVVAFFASSNNNTELKTIESERQLLKLYEGDNSVSKEIFTNFMCMPFSLLTNYSYPYYVNVRAKSSYDITDGLITKDIATAENSSAVSSSTIDYSTTNIQVENVDEADIIKTDGNFIYSLSNNKVIITNVVNPQDIRIESTITLNDSYIPEDLILYKNELIVITTKMTNTGSYYSYYNNSDTCVRIYDISNKSKPILLKSYELYEPYYTSRCINNTLYVISSGALKKENDKIVRTYKENNNEKEIELDNIKYLKDVKTRTQSLISVVNLDNVKADIVVSSYLIDISNAYVSQNSIYLLDEKYKYNDYNVPISSIFGPSGILGVFDTAYNDDNSNGYHTQIYKFEIKSDGNIAYNSTNKISGRTINQYSLDEKNGHLRIALYDTDGARVEILDDSLKEIGASKSVAKGEKMYSSRFINDKAYLVTYKTMDPLFVIDLSNEKKPTVLGELHIPGYSTYLHPYDENHLIGIGMQSEEVTNRNSSGKVISTTARITGMKMALFDVSDVNNPIQISETTIGDSRTTSAILTNPKALLFSKKKNLIAIPVNNYSEDFEVTSSSDTYSSTINSYKNYSKNRVAEGYFVYNIDVHNGFNLKGVITHDTSNNSSYYSYYYNSKLLRGLYIEDNLYTVSESAIKVNNLNTLELVDELKIK